MISRLLLLVILLGTTAMAEPRGVYLLHQGRWGPDVIRAFRQTEWLDGASVRIRWREIEPRENEFDFSAFDAVLAEVKRWNQEHPDRPRNLQIRPLGGVHCPTWFEAAGVKFYSTRMNAQGTHLREIRVPVPYENPEFLKQLRELYGAMIKRYGEEPLVVVYHGTWSAGPWDEIFHPTGEAPLPPGYTKEKFVSGMLEQLDVMLEEVCAKGHVGELPFSGLYPPRSQIDITGPIVDRVVKRLGERSPLLYIQSNGWGITARGRYTASWGHEADLDNARGRVRIAFQALGTNAGGGWIRQGDWRDCVRLAIEYQAHYLEIYTPSLRPLDEQNHLSEAMEQYLKWLDSVAPRPTR